MYHSLRDIQETTSLVIRMYFESKNTRRPNDLGCHYNVTRFVVHPTTFHHECLQLLVYGMEDSSELQEVFDGRHGIEGRQLTKWPRLSALDRWGLSSRQRPFGFVRRVGFDRP